MFADFAVKFDDTVDHTIKLKWIREGGKLNVSFDASVVIAEERRPSWSSALIAVRPEWIKQVRRRTYSFVQVNSEQLRILVKDTINFRGFLPLNGECLKFSFLASASYSIDCNLFGRT